MIPLKGDKAISPGQALGWVLVGLSGRYFSKTLPDSNNCRYVCRKVGVQRFCSYVLQSKSFIRRTNKKAPLKTNVIFGGDVIIYMS